MCLRPIAVRGMAPKTSSSRLVRLSSRRTVVGALLGAEYSRSDRPGQIWSRLNIRLDQLKTHMAGSTKTPGLSVAVDARSPDERGQALGQFQGCEAQLSASMRLRFGQLLDRIAAG